jgi:hypothetical protein
VPHVNQIIETFSDELQAGGPNGSAIKLNAQTHLPALGKIGAEGFSRWVGLR